MEFTIATYNIHRGGMDMNYDYLLLAEDILNSGADVVALQEVDLKTNRNGKSDTMRLLSMYTGRKYCYYAPSYELEGGSCGVGILSKFPMIEPHAVPLPTMQGDLSCSMLHTVIQAEGEKIDCFIVHCRQSALQAQLKCIAELTEKCERYILAGDLNSEDFSLIRKFFPKTAFVNDLHRRIVTTIPHYRNHNSSYAYDNIIFSEYFSMEKYSVIETDRSDHRILCVKLRSN